MPGRSYRVQKKPRESKHNVHRRKAGINTAEEGQSTSASQRKARSVSLSSGPDLADIPAYEPDHNSTDEMPLMPRDDNASHQERQELRDISGNGISGAMSRDKSDHPAERSSQQGRLPSFYSYDIDPRLLPLTKRYPAVNPEYFQEILENRFKPENLAKLSNDFSTSCRSVKKQVKEGDVVRTVNVEVNAVPGDIKNVVDFSRCFGVYREALVHVAEIGRPGSGHQLRSSLTRYLQRMITIASPRRHDIEGILAYHFMFHKTRAILGIDDPIGWISYNARTALGT